MTVFSIEREQVVPSLIAPKGIWAQRTQCVRRSRIVDHFGPNHPSLHASLIRSIAVFWTRCRTAMKELTGAKPGANFDRCRWPKSAILSAKWQELIPTGHLFLWMDKYELVNGFREWLHDNQLAIVDLIVWNKKRLGMGYRTRRGERILDGDAEKNPSRPRVYGLIIRSQMCGMRLFREHIPMPNLSICKRH